MKRVIIDSSSAILLHRCGILPALLECYRAVIPRVVFAELTLPGYDGADMFADLCGTGKIQVNEPADVKAEKLRGNLHAGERGVIALFYKGKGDFIIIDDGHGSAFCRDNNIPYINALLAVKILFLKKPISEAEYIYAWNWLLANGRYSDKIISWAEDADEHTLKSFM